MGITELIGKIYNNSKPGNAMMSLNLYKQGKTWMFDDNIFGIVAEPFVLGMSEIISAYLPEDATECVATFSHNKFPGCETLELQEEEANGGWYEVSDSSDPKIKGMSGWLCPVTRIYMKNIPQNIYYKIEK
jgi:hypothetical protein